MKKLLAALLLFFLAAPSALAAVAGYTDDKREKNFRRRELFKSFAEAMGSGEEEASEGEAGRLARNMNLYERKFRELSTENPIFFMRRVSDPSPDFAAASRAQLESVRDFLESNVSDTGMPLSFRADREYWTGLGEPVNTVESVIERTMVKNTLNIYDGALWQMALTVLPSKKSAAAVDAHTERLLRGSAGDIADLRGYGPAFLYGDEEKTMDRDSGFFFRMISDQYLQDDPLGYNDVPGYPNFDRVHHEDWKPITGEQAWAVIMGPLQVAYIKYGGKIPPDSPEMRLALSVLPALEAMQSPIGAFYHAPKGTYGIHPRLISVENNASVYAALKMLGRALDAGAPEKPRIDAMLAKLDVFFEKDAYNPLASEFYVGGFYVEDKFVAQSFFSTDCQSWVLVALGPEWIDTRFGPGTAFKIFNNLVHVSRLIDSAGRLQGLGFTSDHAALSVEWTCGAILAARVLAEYYAQKDPQWAEDLLKKAGQMRAGIEPFKTDVPGHGTAYLYASHRYFIPFGWWANAIPSTASSAWVIFVDTGFNPFVLGGGPQFRRS